MYSSSRRAERAGFVEVIGRGDGLWAWFGTDFATAGDCLAAATTVLRPACSAAVYRQALSLLNAQRRPSEYLLGGRPARAQLVNRHLRLLAADGVIEIGRATCRARGDMYETY